MALYAPTNPRPQQEDLRKMSAAINRNIKEFQASSVAATVTRTVNLVSTASGSTSTPLPDAVANKGNSVITKNVGSSTNTLTLNAPVGQTIDGVSSKSIGPWNALETYSDGTGWFVI